MTPTYLPLSADALVPNSGEVAARLKIPRSRVDRALTDGELAELRRVSSPACTFVRVNVLRGGDGCIDLGFGAVASRSLNAALDSCNEALVFALTLGAGVDRYLMRLSRTSPARCFIADGLASALCEAACDAAEKIMTGNSEHRPRFSPGYGDLPLEIQPRVLAVTDARRRLGISLNDALLMSPSKSVTAIVGLVSRKS